NPPVGNTQLTITRFVSMRERPLPGTGAPNPTAIARGGTLEYAGTYFWTNPVDPTSGALQYPMSLTAEVTPGGATWMAYHARSSVQRGLGQQPEQQGVSGANGAFCYDPSALQSFRAGQVLDQDPAT